MAIFHWYLKIYKWKSSISLSSIFIAQRRHLFLSLFDSIYLFLHRSNKNKEKKKLRWLKTVQVVFTYFVDWVLCIPCRDNRKYLFLIQRAKVYWEHRLIRSFESNIHLIYNLFLVQRFSYDDSIDHYQWNKVMHNDIDHSEKLFKGKSERNQIDSIFFDRFSHRISIRRCNFVESNWQTP